MGSVDGFGTDVYVYLQRLSHLAQETIYLIFKQGKCNPSCLNSNRLCLAKSKLLYYSVVRDLTRVNQKSKVPSSQDYIYLSNTIGPIAGQRLALSTPLMILYIKPL